MYILKTSLKSEDLQKLEETRLQVEALMPTAITWIVQECQNCKEQVDVQELGESDSPNRCPNCHQAY